MIHILFQSCTEIIELDYPEEASQLVVSSIINPDSSIRVNVNRTQKIEDNSLATINNLKIELFENEEHIMTSSVAENGSYIFDYVPIANRTYQIKIKTDDNEELYATEQLPEAVKISNAYIVPETWFDHDEGHLLSSCGFTIHDPEKEENYYELICYNLSVFFDDSIYSDDNYYKLYSVKCNDFAWKSEGLYDYKPTTLFFSDKTFNGQNYEFKFDYSYHSWRKTVYGNIIEYSMDGEYLYFELRSVSKAYFEYRKNWTKHVHSQGMQEVRDISEMTKYMFSAEPVRMFSNIENGLGIFVGYSSTKIEVELRNK